MGGIDSTAYCQSSARPLFADFLFNGFLAWIDDLLVYAKSDEELLFFACRTGNMAEGLDPNKFSSGSEKCSVVGEFSPVMMFVTVSSAYQFYSNFPQTEAEL